MASRATLAAEKKKREAAANAPKVIDPSAMSWEDYRDALAKKKGKALSPTNIKVAKEEWTKAQAYKSTDSDSLEAQNARAQAAEKDAAVKAAREKALGSQGFQETPSGGTINSQPGTVEDFGTTLKGARAELKKMAPEMRLALAKRLTDAGYPAPLTNVYTDSLLSAYQSAISAAQSAYTANKEFGTLNSYLDDRITQQAAINAAGGGTGKATSYFDKTVFDDTMAANYISSEIKQFLNRDATQQEITSLTKQLKDAQKKNPDRISVDAKGNRTTIRGLDPQGFLDGLIKALPEYTAKQEGKAGTTVENAIATARANGIEPDQSQIDAWRNRVKAGEDINTIQHEIRGIAALGQPDSIKKMLASGTDLGTIYQPYKNAMQSILEIPASQIKLDDNALRMAIGPDKEMNLYEYQKALRQDPRWQYTENAKTDVANSVQKVLQDFGFMG